MRAAPTPIRIALAALFALLLAVRSLAPQGFMPQFDHGAVTIVACPDANLAALAARHHHRHPADHGALHQPCPYAAASLGALGPDWAPLTIAILFFAAMLKLGHSFHFIAPQSARERPPATGPPVLA